MQTFKFFHGTNTPAQVLDAVIGGGNLRDNFHMTPTLSVAQNYGSHVVEIELEGDLTKARVSTINKLGNHNAKVGRGTEVVLVDAAAKAEFFGKLWDARIM